MPDFQNARIYVAGHTGLVGSAIVRRLKTVGCTHIIVRSHREVDLTDQHAVMHLLESERPQYVFAAAAKVGGIHANASCPAEFIYENLSIQTNVLHASYCWGVRRLIFFGSSCAYPKEAPQPLREEYLHGGPLEPTSEPYAMAKLAGISMCAAYNRQYGTQCVPLIPATVYGPGDNFDPLHSHVLPALLRRFVHAARTNAPSVTLWGSGNARREFLYVDDLADACLLVMAHGDDVIEALLDSPAPVLNIGTGEDIAIRDLAHLIAGIVGYHGSIEFDRDKPDGALRKQLDCTKFTRLGWRPSVALGDGIRRTYGWFERAS